MRRVVAIGGGHGLAQILRGLKLLDEVAITGICGNTDDGGSTKKAIIEYGAASYLGDLTRLVIALCSDEAFAAALDYRFKSGSLEGWTPRHVMLLALEKIYSEDPDKALEILCRYCRTGSNRVMPMTRDRVSLQSVLSQLGRQDQNRPNLLKLEGEAELDAITQNRAWPALSLKGLSLSAPAKISKRPARAIRRAHYIVIAPGSFYGSIIATLLPEGVIRAFAESNAEIVLFLNVCKTAGETHHFDAGDFVQRVQAVIGKSVHHVVCDNSKIARKLARAGRERISWKDFLDEEREIGPVCRVRTAPLASMTPDGQCLHDPQLVADFFQSLFAEKEKEKAATAA